MYCLVPDSSQSLALRHLHDRLLPLANSPQLLAGSGLGLLCQKEVYDLRNIVLRDDTLVILVRGEKHVTAASTAAMSADTTANISKGSMLYMLAGQSYRVNNIPDAQGFYLAFLVTFPADAVQRIAKASFMNKTTGHGLPHGPTSSMLYDLLHTYLDLVLRYADPYLASLQQDQLLYALHLAGVQSFTPRADMASRVRSLVEAEPDAPWTATNMARRMNMSERSLRRHLEDCGTSFAETVRLARLHVGLSLLQQSSINVTEASLACGYASPSRFAARFREYFGVAPSDVARARGIMASVGADKTGTSAAK